ncbi:MAG: hypothetical protein Kow0042_28680 [Calditrichia bacterium]
MAATKTYNFGTLHGMMGFNRVGGDDDVFYFGFALDFTLTERWAVGAEITGDRRYPHRRLKEDLYSCMLGTTYVVSSRVILDTSIRLGLTKAAPDLNLALGASFSIR